MADIDVQQHPMGLPRSVGSASLNDTFDLHQGYKDDNEAIDGSLVQEEDDDDDDDDDSDDDGDDWLLHDELAKLRAEWDDYVDTLEGELENDDDYPPIDMKERLRQLNEEWGAEKEVVRTNTKVSFSEQLISMEVPPAGYQDDHDSDLEIENRVSQVMKEEEEAERKGDGDKEEVDRKEAKDVGNDEMGEGDRDDGELPEMYAKQLSLTEQENKEDKRTDLANENQVQIIGSSPEKVVNSDSVNAEIEKEENLQTETEISSESILTTPNKQREEQVLIERDGKFELQKVSELSAEERDMMGIGSPLEKDRKSNNAAEGLASPGHGNLKGDKPESEKSQTPKKKERPSTAKSYESPQRQPVQKRRIQSAKTATPATPEVGQYDRPEGFSKYGLSPDQKELKKKQLMIKSQRLQEKRQREEEEKKRQQEEAESAFQAWVKRKQQEAVERKKMERQKQKGTDHVKIQKDPKDAEESYENWLKAKKQQAMVERKVNKQMKKEEKEAYFYRSRGECDEAFKQWLKTKKKQVREDDAMKQSAARQTTQTAQKSRKARNLSKALQVEQTYKHTDYYGYRF